jgi:hypothetical protein
MRARFWLWMALAMFGAACGLDPQPTLPRGTETDHGSPGPGAVPPVATSPMPSPTFGSPGGVVVDLPDAEQPVRPDTNGAGSSAGGTSQTPETPDPSHPGDSAASGGEGGATSDGAGGAAGGDGDDAAGEGGGGGHDDG